MYASNHRDCVCGRRELDDAESRRVVVELDRGNHVSNAVHLQSALERVQAARVVDKKDNIEVELGSIAQRVRRRQRST